MTTMKRFAELLHAIAADAHANLNDNDRADRQLILEQVLDDIDTLAGQIATEGAEDTNTSTWPTNPGR